MNKKTIAKALHSESRNSGNSNINTAERHCLSAKLWAVPVILLAAVGMTTPSRSFADETNLVVNGDFEDPAIQCGLWVSVPLGSGFITGWNVNIPSTNNDNGGCDYIPFYADSVDLLVNPGGPYVYSGRQAIDMAGSYSTAGDSIYQDIPTKPGRTYTLTFYTSSNGGGKENGLTVEWDDIPIATISTVALGLWSTNSFTVQANSTVSRLRFVDNISGGQGSLLDNVSLVGAADDPPPPPVVSCPPSITVPFGSVPPAATNIADLTAQGGSITNNQDPNPLVTSSDVVTGSCPMLVTRTYTVTDASGSTQCQQLITVQNLFAPDGIRWAPPLARFDRPDDPDPGDCEFVFKRGHTIPIKIRARSCDEKDLTRTNNIIGTLEVLALSNCEDLSTGRPVVIEHNGLGGDGGLMVKAGGWLRYNLNTKVLPTDTHCFLLKATVMNVTTGETLSEMLPIDCR
jgi:hypothetical protein